MSLYTNTFGNFWPPYISIHNNKCQMSPLVHIMLIIKSTAFNWSEIIIWHRIYSRLSLLCSLSYHKRMSKWSHFYQVTLFQTSCRFTVWQCFPDRPARGTLLASKTGNNEYVLGQRASCIVHKTKYENEG